ncbi:MAG: hypothetical protein JW881_00240 [Spirochaetales bacterium]|nr:hypothetical protein [Spirochaetales bacterium]
MLAIILLSIGVIVSFTVLAAMVINLVVKVVQKKTVNKPAAIISIGSVFLLWVVLGCVNAFVIFSYVFEHKDEIIDSGIETTADIMAKTLVLTYKGVEKNWDAQLVKKLKNVSVTVSGSSHRLEKENRIYTIELLFDNPNPSSDNIGFYDLVNGNYLMVCDTEDIIYGLDMVTCQSTYLPEGKTKAVFKVLVDEDVELSYIRFVESRIDL